MAIVGWPMITPCNTLFVPGSQVLYFSSLSVQDLKKPVIFIIIFASMSTSFKKVIIYTNETGAFFLLEKERYTFKAKKAKAFKSIKK